ncbi:hypothetical protein [Bradyrhizobium iriomotense]|uniref:hypothetical protein n=1 Tax=Bradyrhizobium iriomotense TaxID=441950 RepID=UPI001B8A7BF3|nr:hypothetical protein [Bradyrhizobium iriomotense]MBR0783175.1 hypothetical protein [Bradyrhizobium iriomotense]
MSGNQTRSVVAQVEQDQIGTRALAWAVAWIVEFAAGDEKHRSSYRKKLSVARSRERRAKASIVQRRGREIVEDDGRLDSLRF